MLKLKRLIGEVLFINHGQERVTVRVQRIHEKRVTLTLTKFVQEGDVVSFTLGGENVRIVIDDVMSKSVLLGIDAPRSVGVWRAELTDREDQPGEGEGDAH